MSWDDDIELFGMAQRARGLSELTIRMRTQAVGVMAATLAGRGITSPDQVTSRSLKVYMAAQVRERQGSGPRAHHSSLSQFWSWYAEEYGAPSPMAGVPVPRRVTNRTPVLSDDEIRAILAACADKTDLMQLRDRAAVLTLLSTGMRREELCLLQVRDVDLPRRSIVIRRGKGGKSRAVVPGDLACQALQRYLKAVRRAYPYLAGSDRAPLFAGRSGGPMTVKALTQAMVRLGERAELPFRLRCHLFRHRWAHAALAAGIGESNVVELGGWSSFAELARYGATLRSERARAAALAVSLDRL